jgi:hypothetical protein
MKKTSILFVFMIAVLAFAAWPPNSEALEAFGPDVTECMACHDAGPPPPLSNPIVVPLPIELIWIGGSVATPATQSMMILRSRVYAPDAIKAYRG